MSSGDYISKSALIEELQKRIGGDLDIEDVEYLEKVVDSIPTLDKKEIIRKAFERAIEKLCDLQPFLTADGQYVSLYEVVQTIKKECGISE